MSEYGLTLIGLVMSRPKILERINTCYQRKTSCMELQKQAVVAISNMEADFLAGAMSVLEWGRIRQLLMKLLTK